MPPVFGHTKWLSSVQFATKVWPPGNTTTTAAWPWTQGGRASKRGYRGHKLDLQYHCDDVVFILKQTRMCVQREARMNGGKDRDRERDGVGQRACCSTRC